MQFNNPRPLDPVHLSLTAVNFDNSHQILSAFSITCLDELLCKMDSHTITFHVNVTDEHKIEPLETIIEMIKSNKKITVTKSNSDHNGRVIFEIILNEFQFVSINNLFDFSYSKGNDIMELEVSYTFKDIEYVNINDSTMKRALKIHKILNKEYMWSHLTKKELNIL